MQVVLFNLFKDMEVKEPILRTLIQRSENKEFVLPNFQRDYVWPVENQKKLLSVKNAPNPDDILWENLYVSYFSLFLRRSISIIITLSMVIGGIRFLYIKFNLIFF